jgi:hypothetical protein
MAGIQLVPGQTFQCTLQEQELTDLANNYPDSPCSKTGFTLDDGEIEMTCRIGITMRAFLGVSIKNCRIQIEVLRGTPAFKQIIQGLISTQFDVIQYDSICIDQVEIDGGEITVGGYGR